MADMYHPIVQIHAGSEVNIVFLKGFSLTEGLDVADSVSRIRSTKKVETVNKNNDSFASQDEVNQNLMRTIKNTHLGQGVDYNDGGELR